MLFVIMLLGLMCGAFGEDQDPLLKEKLLTLMNKQTPGGYISLQDLLGYLEENQLTWKEELEFKKLGGGNVSYIRIILKV